MMIQIRTIGRSGNQRVADANATAPRVMFGNFIKERQLSILCAKTGVGKTILAMSIADVISKGKKSLLGCPNECESMKVNYYDFELNDDQFKERYYNHQWNSNITFFTDKELRGQTLTIDQIREDAMVSQAGLIVIDNITMMLGTKTYNAKTSLDTFSNLKKLANEGLTILVLCHTPKLKVSKILTEDDIAGSSMAVRQVDSAFFIAQSGKGINTRYIKQVKSRSIKEHRIMEVEKRDLEGFLTFEFTDWSDDEREHFGQPQSKEQIIDWEEIFDGAEKLKASDIKSRLMDIYGMGDSTARRYCSNHLEQISEEYGWYKIPA